MSLIYKPWKSIYIIYIYDYICFLQYIIYTYSAYFEFSPANKIPIKGFSFTKNLWFHGTFMSRCPRRGIMAFCGLVVALLLDWAGLCWLCWFCIFICSYHKTKIYVYIYILLYYLLLYIYIHVLDSIGSILHIVILCRIYQSIHSVMKGANTCQYYLQRNGRFSR